MGRAGQCVNQPRISGGRSGVLATSPPPGPPQCERCRAHCPYGHGRRREHSVPHVRDDMGPCSRRRPNLGLPALFLVALPAKSRFPPPLLRGVVAVVGLLAASLIGRAVPHGIEWSLQYAPALVVLIGLGVYHLTLIHRRRACRRPAEETKGCAAESGIMVLKQKTGPRKGAPDRCYHVTTPTASKSPSTTTAWWPMPADPSRHPGPAPWPAPTPPEAPRPRRRAGPGEHRRQDDDPGGLRPSRRRLHRRRRCAARRRDRPRARFHG